jgi:chromate reductase, NAD(P)H dehydrogenase (quinone)
MEQSLRFVGICGSLREGSYNRLLLKAAGECLPKYVQFSLLDVSQIPMYNQDLEAPTMPSAVLDLKRQVEQADALLISTPEYNYSIPGMLKNVIDWLSRPSGQSSLNEKPVAVMGGTPGNYGAAMAQNHLRQILNALNMHVINRPGILVPQIHLKFNPQGQLTDEIVKNLLKDLMDALIKRTFIFRQVPGTFLK